jgi:two-component system LytT family response regulator
VVKTGNQIRIIPTQEIQYIEACDDYVKIYTAAEVFMKKKTMQHFEQTLNPAEFVRVHRSYILQLSQITRIELVEKDTHIAITKKGIRIPLSKTGYAKLKEILDL